MLRALLDLVRSTFSTLRSQWRTRAALASENLMLRQKDIIELLVAKGAKKSQ